MTKQVLFKTWGGQLIDGYVHKQFLCFSLIEYGLVITRLSGHEDESRRIHWFPNWRIIK